MKYLLLFPLIFCVLFSFGQNQSPEVQNLKSTFSYIEDRMTITFDLVDIENDSLEVSLFLSDDSGVSYQVDISNAAGDLGFPIFEGTNKQITWDAPQPINTVIHRVKVVATDRKLIDVQAIVDQVDSARLKNELMWIEGIRSPAVGLNHLEDVKDSLEKRFNQYGLQVERQGLNSSGYFMENIIGRHTGVKAESNVYIIDGHFDSVPTSPGADDNGSAVTGVIEAARILSKYHFANTINFINFDLEEANGVGSQHYVNTGIRPFETVKGVVNLEMIGYYDDRPNTQTFPTGFDLVFPAASAAVIADSSRGNFITNVSNQNSASLGNKFEACANQYVPDLRVISVESPGNGLLVPDLLRSDHAFFWIAGIDALMITDGADFRNNNYHTPGDTIGTLDFNFMTQVVKASIATIAELAQPVSAGQSISEVTVLNTSLEEWLVECGDMKYFETASHIEIDLSESPCIKESSTFKIFNIEGKLIQQRAIDLNVPSIRLDKRNYAKGVYFLSWETSKGQLSRKILIR